MMPLFIRRAVIVVCVCALTAVPQKLLHAVELHQLRIAEDETKTISERLKAVSKLLAEEIREPSDPKGSYAHSRHDWVLVNIAGVMGSLAARDETLKSTLRKNLDEEPNLDAKRILCIALGIAGEQSIWKKLKEVVLLEDRPWLQEYAVSAAMDSKSVLLVPDLIELLKHPRHYTDRGGIEYPVRRRAFLALRDLGVQIEMLEPEDKGEFKFDRASAVRVVATKLGSKERDEVVATIEAISRVGGDEAIRQLTVFVDASQKGLQKAAEVGFAQAIIESLRKDRMKKR